MRALALFLTLMTCAVGPAWTQTSQAPRPTLTHRENLCLVYDVTDTATRNGIGKIFAAVPAILDTYRELEVPREELTIHTVFHGAAAQWLLRDAAYARGAPVAAANPNAAAVAHLLGLGVRVEICANTMKREGWSREDLLPGVEVVPGAVIRIVDLQLSGCALVPF